MGVGRCNNKIISAIYIYFMLKNAHGQSLYWVILCGFFCIHVYAKETAWHDVQFSRGNLRKKKIKHDSFKLAFHENNGRPVTEMRWNYNLRQTCWDGFSISLLPLPPSQCCHLPKDVNCAHFIVKIVNTEPGERGPPEHQFNTSYADINVQKVR